MKRNQNGALMLTLDEIVNKQFWLEEVRRGVHKGILRNKELTGDHTSHQSSPPLLNT